MKKLLAFVCLLCASAVASSPTIEARYSAVSQTGSIAQTAVFTATATALYRYSFYGEVGPCSSSGPSVTLSWTDDNSSSNASQTFSLICSGTLNFATTTVQAFRLVSGSSLNIAVTESSGNPTYSVYVVVEKL